MPALLVAVVALLCVVGHAERGGPGAHPSVPQQARAATVSEGSDAPAAPCGKKMIVDHSTQRAETPPPTASCPGPAAPHAPATPRSQHSGTLSGGPAPPPPTTLHSVPRIWTGLSAVSLNP